MQWDEWRGNTKPAMWLKRLLFIKWLNWRLDGEMTKIRLFLELSEPQCTRP